MIDKDKLKMILYRLDWIKILDRAIKMRPTSWNDNPVREWRNASDEINFAVVHALEEEGILNKFLTNRENTKKAGKHNAK
jgi:hypothetical protein